MLSELYIENIAVIKKAAISFETGFVVFSGETGAGKSILIDSINAVMGERFSKDLVRTGEERAFISALFEGLRPETSSFLEELGFAPEEDSLLLSREIRADGRSTFKIGGKPATASIMRKLSATLINIHGQHDSQELLLPERHMTFIDRFGGLEPLVEEYHTVYQKARSAKRELKMSRMDENEKLQRLDMLRFQIEEIESAALVPGEEEELESRRSVMQNFEVISKSLSDAYYKLTGDENISGVNDLLAQVAGHLEAVGDCMPGISTAARKLREMSFEVEEYTGEVRDALDAAEFSPEELNFIENRLDLIHQLKRKYGENIPKILEFHAKSVAELAKIECSDERLEQLRSAYQALLEATREKARALSAARSRTAKAFTAKVQRELTFLDMPAVVFTTRQEQAELLPTGMDKIEFLISTNPGEAPKPLAKIASGGELSRIMLAIKSVLAGQDTVDTLIFDEIDTGVSGRAAQKIGAKLKGLAASKQVMCITHLPQIASQGGSHLLIAKEAREGHTYTSVTRLDAEGRVDELARMIGGETITETTRQNARELLGLSK